MCETKEVMELAEKILEVCLFPSESVPVQCLTRLRELVFVHGERIPDWREILEHEGLQQRHLVGLVSRCASESEMNVVNELLGWWAGQGHTQRTVVLDSTLQVDECGMESGAGLGGLMWPAAPILAQALLDAKHDIQVKGRRVLELGCGCCPLPTIACLQLEAKTVVATDIDVPVLLQTAINNIQRNTTHSKHLVDFHVVPLDWEEVDNSLQHHQHVLIPESFDLIIGSDLVYDPCHAELLPKVIHTFLNKSHNSCVFLILGDRARNRGMETFEQEMTRFGFKLFFDDRSTELTHLVYKISG